MDLSYQDVVPSPDSRCFIAPNASVVGRVTLGIETTIWYAAVIRGDTEQIEVSDHSNIQDGAILHADAGVPCRIGPRVSVGHGAVIHGALVESDCLIGIRSVILNGARIGAGSIIAAGCLVPERTVIPPGSVVMGVPGKIVRETSPADRERIEHAWKHYAQVARQLAAGDLQE